MKESDVPRAAREVEEAVPLTDTGLILHMAKEVWRRFADAPSHLKEAVLEEALRLRSRRYL